MSAASMYESVLTEVALGVGILWALRQRILQGVPGSRQVPEGVPGTAQQLARPAVHWIEVQGTPAHHCQYDARCTDGAKAQYESHVYREHHQTPAKCDVRP